MRWRVHAVPVSTVPDWVLVGVASVAFTGTVLASARSLTLAEIIGWISGAGVVGCLALLRRLRSATYPAMVAQRLVATPFASPVDLDFWLAAGVLGMSPVMAAAIWWAFSERQIFTGVTLCILGLSLPLSWCWYRRGAARRDAMIAETDDLISRLGHLNDSD